MNEYQRELAELKRWDAKITKPLPPIIQHWRNKWIQRINRLYEQHVINTLYNEKVQDARRAYDVLRKEQRTTQDETARVSTSA